MSDDLKLFLAEKVIEKQKEELAALLARHNALKDAARPVAAWWIGARASDEEEPMPCVSTAQLDALAALALEE